tara:strand:- start:785 stop:1789 length:1005 start_codon:yes stop_codon:yes gene_type:complete
MKKILITGGTGSFGNAFVNYIFNNFKDIERVVIFSRDELKQWEMRQRFPESKYPQLRFFLGDIRDRYRIQRALEKIDTVIHASALKHVPLAEYNPIEFVKTNVLGAENLINACLDSDVKKVIALSTDKAAAPINLYGATKLCSDKLFTAANNIKGSRDITFSMVRYGNVLGSRGSVVPFFLKKAKTNVLPITDARMTRFNITLREGVEMVNWVIKNAVGGEIFVPKIPSYKILDLANAIGPSCEKKFIGVRSGEKIHEEMITISDSLNTHDFGKYYCVLPTSSNIIEKFNKKGIYPKKVKEGFSYNSGNNNNFLKIDEIRKLIIENIDKNFKPI